MIASILRMAMRSPGRQTAFRRIAAAHALLAAFAFGFLPAAAAAQVMLVLGILEGAALIGWRLVQIPKSPALEFMLVSAVSPRTFFLAELAAGCGRFLLVQLAALPAFAILIAQPGVHWPDAVVIGLMPALWGLFAGVALTVWIYEPRSLRRIGEGAALLGVLFYLVIGVLAAERLPAWLHALPPALGEFAFHAVMALNNYNPFGTLRYWFSADRSAAVALDRMLLLHAALLTCTLLLAARAGLRLVGHFHDRHYRPIDSRRPEQTGMIGERPLAWWAVRRVMEYSGRVNLYLAGGFCLAYAAYILAGDDWPAWIGRGAFVLFDNLGGPAMLATAMAVMAAVPAAYQFGLWDSSAAERSRRLELLLLTELDGNDYAHAAFRAAWRRGRGYMLAAAALWIACAAAHRISWPDAFAAALGSAALWAFAFALGFRGFTTGHQTNGIASLLTLGAPMLLFALWSAGFHTVAAFVPTAAAYLPLKTGATLPWAAGFAVTAAAACWLLADSIRRCDASLRDWLSANAGRAA